jgi:hypothetical protein
MNQYHMAVVLKWYNHFCLWAFFNEGEIVNRLCMHQYPTFIPLLSNINPTLRSFPMEKAVYVRNLFLQFFLDDSKS